jgi:hypothetical protein|tara:strand:- start:1479 stop:2072 length:594 start_codon:yes stop_codon:yes gene_type:complete
MYTKEQIESAVKVKGYAWFENGDYNVNIVGVRNTATGNVVTNVFDDLLTLSYKENGVWKFHSWAATTDPGKKGVMEFHNTNGVARLVEGQYRGVWKIDLHQGKYEALCQRLGNVKVYRDKNKNMTFDEVEVQEGSFGINIHKSNPTTESQYVENWSEGCQVFKRVKNFNEFMTICKKASAIHGNKFSYTLLESADIK